MKFQRRERRYWNTTLHCYPASLPCEHCDGADSFMVRHDLYRGRVCPICDRALDRMLHETASE